MASKLKRVSEDTDTAITELAEREQRTFVNQLDIVVKAGLEAMGKGTVPTAPARKRAATKKAAAATP